MLDSFKKSFALIWRNKPLFFLLLIAQIIFLAIFSFVSITYQTKVLESAKAMADYINQQQLDDVTITSRIINQESILGDDPLSISRNFNAMVSNFRIYLIYAFILLAVFMSISWTLTSRLVHKSKFKHLIKQCFRIFVVSFFYLGLIFWFFYSLLNISLIQAGTELSKLLAKYLVFLIFSIILAYFMFVSISLSNNTGLKSIAQKTLHIGIKKAHYILSAYFIIMLFFITPLSLMYYFIEKNILILLLSILLLIFSFVFGRILMVYVVEKLNRDYNNRHK